MIYKFSHERFCNYCLYVYIFLFLHFSDSDSKIGPKIPQVQDQRYQHPHQQGMQHSSSIQQPPIYSGYPTHSAPGIPPGPPPAPYPGYVPSSAPFAHQLPGYISPLTTQGTNIISQQSSQVFTTIPQQIHRPNSSLAMSTSSVPAPPLPPTPLAMGQSSLAPPAPPTPPPPPSKIGRAVDDEAELPAMLKRQKMDALSGGSLVSVEEWIESHQVTLYCIHLAMYNI